MARDIDISLLRAFVAVADTGSVTAAARLLNRTQAAVSQQLKRLEELFGVGLFQREHKRVALAPPGEQLLDSARRLIAMNDEVWGMMTTPSYNGEVRLGVPFDIVPTYAPNILRRFAQAWPQVQVSLATQNSVELVELLDDGKIDLTITTELGPSRENGELLRRDRLVWVTAPDSDAHLRRPLPISIGGRTCLFRPVVLDALRAEDIEWRFVVEVSNQEAVNATIAAGLGVAAMLADSVPDGLVVLEDDAGLPPLPEFSIILYLPRTGSTELAEELACHIRTEFALRFGSAGLMRAPAAASRPMRRSGAGAQAPRLVSSA
ncbi:MAG: LysR substrate-binding domain-containing protein [Pseudomonadota bacterium]